MDNEILRIGIEAVLGCTTLLGFILYYKQTKRMKNAEALNAEIEADQHQFDLYKAQLEHCSEAVENHNQTIIHQTQTITELNDAISNKTTRIRELTDALFESERETNAVNAKLVDATSKIGELELQLAKARMWRCELANCDKRVPPNPKLKGKKYDENE